jgi:biotin synthase-like enzyme
MAGANSIFYGEKLLTTGNPDTAHDRRLFERLNLVAEPASHAPGATFVAAEPAPLVESAEYHSATA